MYEIKRKSFKYEINNYKEKYHIFIKNKPYILYF